MKTWKIVDGDLQIGARGFSTVDGDAKVQQDLYCATSEPYGSDPYHPGWGCLLGNYIGTAINTPTEGLVESEIARVVNNYMLVQQDIMTTLAAAGLANQYTDADIVASVDSIEVTQSTTNPSALNVVVSLTTQAGATVSVSNSTGS